MSVGAAELALIVVQYLERHGCQQAASAFRREAQHCICPLPAVYHKLRSLESIVDEYMLLKHQRDRLQNLSKQHPVLGSIITTLNLHAGSAAVAATPMHAPPPPATDAAPAPRPPAHPGLHQPGCGDTPHRPPAAAKSTAPDLESTGKTPAQDMDVVWTVKKERHKRSREESESDAPRQGARKSLRYEGSRQETMGRKGSQQETVGGGGGGSKGASKGTSRGASKGASRGASKGASKGCHSAPSPAPRPLPPVAAPSPPPAPAPARNTTTLAGNAVIRALQQQQVVGSDAVRPVPHVAGSPPPPPLVLPLLGSDTFGGLTNLFASDSLFGLPLDTSPHKGSGGSSEGKENAGETEPPVRKASQAAIEAFLGTIAT